MLALLLTVLTADVGVRAETLLPPDPSVSLGRTIPFDGFVDEDGRDFAAAEAEPRAEDGERPWIVSPIYTRCPHTCSALTAGLRRALEQSGLQPSDYRVLSFSFDPDETAEGLKTFRTRMSLPRDWLTLRAVDREVLDRTLRSLDFRTIATGDGQFQHPNLVAVLTPDMKLAGYVFGVNFSSSELARTVTRARRGVSALDRWAGSLFFFAAVGFVITAFFFVSLIYRRRKRSVPSRPPVTVRSDCT